MFPITSPCYHSQTTASQPVSAAAAAWIFSSGFKVLTTKSSQTSCACGHGSVLWSLLPSALILLISLRDRLCSGGGAFVWSRHPDEENAAVCVQWAWTNSAGSSSAFKSPLFLLCCCWSKKKKKMKRLEKSLIAIQALTVRVMRLQ